MRCLSNQFRSQKIKSQSKFLREMQNTRVQTFKLKFWNGLRQTISVKSEIVWEYVLKWLCTVDIYILYDYWYGPQKTIDIINYFQMFFYNYQSNFSNKVTTCYSYRFFLASLIFCASIVSTSQCQSVKTNPLYGANCSMVSIW